MLPRHCAQPIPQRQSEYKLGRLLVHRGIAAPSLGTRQHVTCYKPEMRIHGLSRRDCCTRLTADCAATSCKLQMNLQIGATSGTNVRPVPPRASDIVGTHDCRALEHPQHAIASGSQRPAGQAPHHDRSRSNGKDATTCVHWLATNWRVPSTSPLQSKHIARGCPWRTARAKRGTMQSSGRPGKLRRDVTVQVDGRARPERNVDRVGGARVDAVHEARGAIDGAQLRIEHRARAFRDKNVRDLAAEPREQLGQRVVRARPASAVRRPQNWPSRRSLCLPRGAQASNALARARALAMPAVQNRGNRFARAAVVRFEKQLSYRLRDVERAHHV